eukprot:CAMPEP_0184489012 /NCGR_PEP_ID=MMETSP0113_2-20130426/14135_1 /TAXON_ID=91329 /ORGANISM="Norrisiella sphaerica, Strain BC52" /LENGTH=108 /DNA_ID=CAMNT_0026872187 /DNA_START=373 /DNA_END=696 /DNA_ORIENTATION=+
MAILNAPNSFFKAAPSREPANFAPSLAEMMPDIEMAAAARQSTFSEATYPTAPPAPQAATAASDVACAVCCVILRTPVINGSEMNAPPIPTRLPANPAMLPMAAALTW